MSFLLVGCSVNTSPTPNAYEDPYIDPDKQDLPTYTDAQKIYEDMTINEVTALIGKAQKIIPIRELSGVPSPMYAFYDLSNKGVIVIKFSYDFQLQTEVVRE